MISTFAVLALFASEPAEPVSVVDAYYAAFNSRDVASMAELLAPDARTIYLGDDGSAQRVEGADTIVEGLDAYFAALPDVHNAVEILHVNGPQILLDETVRWTGENGQARAQSAMAVYRVDGTGRIDAVWYLPSVQQ